MSRSQSAPPGGIVSRKALLIGLLVFFAASHAFAGAEPVVCWSADAVPTCDCSSATPSVIPDGSTTFHLYLETGSTVSTGTACEFSSTDPNGDEVCAIALGLESTDADLAIDGFAAAASGAVSNLIAANNLVINYFDSLGTGMSGARKRRRHLYATCLAGEPVAPNSAHGDHQRMDERSARDGDLSGHGSP